MEIISCKRWEKLNLAAINGDADAQWELGFLYEFGVADKSRKVIAEKNTATALVWYDASAKQGVSNAQHALSRLLSTGDASWRDFPKAIYWAKKAIAQGDASAAFNLGTIYRDQGKPKLALRWYQRAAAMGDVDAFLEIGLCHFFGWGTKQDLGSALSAFGEIIELDPSTCSQRAKENACYWAAVVLLASGASASAKVARVRSLLEAANADDDHEQANDLLNLIGKSKYMQRLLPPVSSKI